MKSTAFASVLVTTAVGSFSNSVPIYGTYPGWKEGGDKANITLELHYDLLCEDSKGLDPIISKLLATKWLDGTVRDQITVEYTLIPLPYHLHAWQVNQLMPFFIDMCMADSKKCMMDKYKDYAFEQQPKVLAEDTISKDEFTKQWSAQVAKEFGLKEEEVALCYDRSKDPHNTEGKLREMWKYATSNTVSGTPTALINGVKLDSNPDSVEGWLDVLNNVYKSQWPQHKDETLLQ